MKPIQDFLSEWLPDHTFRPEPIRNFAYLSIYQASDGVTPVELGYADVPEQLTSDDLVLGLLSGAPFLLYETDEHVLVMSRRQALNNLQQTMSAEELLMALAYWLAEEHHAHIQRPEAMLA